MIIDALLKLSTAQAVSATADSTNSVLFDSQAVKVGVGEELYVHASLSAALVGAGSIAATMVFGDDASFTNTEIFTLGTFASADPAGTKLIQRLPITKGKKSYFKVVYTVSGSASTTINCQIVKDVDASEVYEDAITIS